MTNNLHNIVVYIKDEAMLQEAREILERYGESITTDGSFALTKKPIGLNYLQLDSFDNEFYLGLKSNLDTEITIQKLERLLKQNIK